MIRPIKTSGGDSCDIETNDPVILDWFARPHETHTDIIIDQINQGMYDRYISKSNMVVIDAGANIGLFGIYAYDRCKKLVMVEPAPHNLYIMQELLGHLGAVEIDDCALGMEDGQIKLNIHSSPTCNSIVYDSDTDLSIDVKTKCLATLLQDHGLDVVDFIKCDIEGAELLAITDQTLDPVATRINSWLIEAHNTSGLEWPGNLRSNRDMIASVMKNHGYNTEYIIHDQLYAFR